MSECHFGKKTYELEEAWHPDLGSPFGVMYCVHCECTQVHRKKRIVGKVRCKNIKNECPEQLQCDEPVLLAGQCCKTCPLNTYDGMQLEEEMARKYDSDDTGNEYAALLTAPPGGPLASVASGRFVFHSRNLHYSILYIGSEAPTAVHFADGKGYVVEEHRAHVTKESSDTYKICGVWRKVAKVYRKLLRHDGSVSNGPGNGISARVVTESHPDGVVSGALTRLFAVNTETFSALLRVNGVECGSDCAAGGLAVISTASTQQAAHFLLLLRGLPPQDKDGKEWSTVSVHLQAHQDDDRLVTVEETLVVIKRTNDASVAEMKLNLDAGHFALMARGRLLLSVQPSKHSANLRLSARISPKLTCNVFEALMTGAEGQPHGVAVFRLAGDGAIPYVIRMEDMGLGQVTSLSLVLPLKKKGKTFQDLMPAYQDGWANGSLTRPTAREVELLTGDELDMEAVMTLAGRSFDLRGHIRQRLFHYAHTALVPTLLKGTGTSMAGRVWVAVDQQSCSLHYELVLTQGHGQGQSRKGSKKEVSMGIVELIDLSPDAGKERISLGEMTTVEEAEDEVEEVSVDAMVKLGTGALALQVRFNDTSYVQGALGPVPTGPKCVPGLRDITMVNEESNTLQEVYSCTVDAGREVEDGAQWTSETDSCLMCSCQRGRIVCDPIVCPTVPCIDAKTNAGDCCPSCPTYGASADPRDNDSHRVCYFDGDKKFHAAGAIWHPYIPPFGFSKCAVCTCNATTLKVSCDRITCPTLSCRDKEAYREHPLACCKVCPSLVKLPNPAKGTDELLDEGRPKTSKELLAEGGCNVRGITYPNGHEWHPKVHSFGEMPCIKCSCKDGKWKCKRPKCHNLTCQEKVVSDNECCPKCAEPSTTPKPPPSSSPRKHKSTKGVGATP